jgi:hydrogenase/urease accessory protein HupE
MTQTNKICNLKANSHAKMFNTKYVVVGLLLLILPFFSTAHEVVVEIDDLSTSNIIKVYLIEGFKHIIPLGFDHILFIVGLFLLTPKLKPLLYQASVFTIAHTITLGLTTLQVIKPQSNIVEPVIAISIAFIAIENIVASKLNKWRLLVVFIFGLIHGMGFASALDDVGLPKNNFYTALFTFNLGVELAQVAIILFAYYTVGKWFYSKKWYKQFVVTPISLLIAAIAIYWTIERIFF